MKPLTQDDLLDVESYRDLRPAYRARVIAHKDARRVGVGERLTLLFEDRETVRYQILEMARVEGARTPAQVQTELDVYNELVPGKGELSATLFIEIPELETIRPELDRLIGIDECVQLVLGDGTDEEQVTADFDRRQLEEDRISAVHYLHFRLSPAQVDRFSGDTRLRLRVDHPAYQHEVDLGHATRASLLRDLSGEGTVLLDPSESLRDAEAGEQTLIETESVRAYRPARPLGPDHVIVEAREPISSLLVADSTTLGELLDVVKELAREIQQRRGRCRVWTDIDPAEPRLRWHIAAPRE
jgi:hypothetical protein